MYVTSYDPSDEPFVRVTRNRSKWWNPLTWKTWTVETNYKGRTVSYNIRAFDEIEAVDKVIKETTYF